MSDAPDDPERRFRRLPKVLRRWTFRTLSRRLRQPVRRRRWDAENRTVTAAYIKPALQEEIARSGDDSIRSLDSSPVREREKSPPPSGEGRVGVGDFSGHSGLSRAGRYELERLSREYPELDSRDLGPAIHGREPLTARDGPPVGRLYLLSAPDTYATLFRAFPPERLRHAWRTGLWVWETPIFPRAWRFALDLVDEIWTPSDYSRQAILPVAGHRPVRVRPHAVTAAAPPGGTEAIRSRFGIGAGVFLGLAIMDIMSCPARKNPWAHVAAWRLAFGDDPEAVLLLKIRVSKRTRVVLDELREMIGQAPNIRIVEAELTGAEITALQAGADVYLSLHRAEGYGLNIHECLAFGTPVVATDFSANAEYGPAFDGYRPVPYRLVPYRDWTGHYAERGFEWAEADIGAAAEILRDLRR